ncbi:hypothetical protein ACQ86G_21490 [Roseateles chitinivorans]|uniref:hypothetical protein n=1 Tax=Roseateles chitinivorans TaxID=2917965 RepID=UPI003D667D21
MAGIFDIPGYSDWTGSGIPDTSLISVWDTANSYGQNPQNTQPRTADTVPTNAIGSMQPIQSGGFDMGNWGGFLQQGLGALLGYGLTKDAVQSGVVRPVGVLPNGQQAQGTVQPGQAYAQPQILPGIGLTQMLLIGGVIFAVVKLAK